MSRKTTSKMRKTEAVLGVEPLESRDLMSVSQVWFSGTTLCVKTNDASTNVELRQSGSQVAVTDVSGGHTWSYATAQVGRFEFQGGAGNDHFVNYSSNMAVRAWGFGGNDYLEGYNGADYLDGGAGNDTLVGYGGDDLIYAGSGDDVLLGGAGNDQLVGQDGRDRLNGQAGVDRMWGGAGDDVLIAIDNALGDYAQGDAGADTYWVDRNGSSRDSIYGIDSSDKVQAVDRFANGADRTLNGDRIADPTVKSGYTYRTFSGNPLFSSAGPRLDDIRQGQLGDCYLLAGLGAIAGDSPNAIRQNIVDFDDGTYGVRLGNSFYRVDNNLPVSSSSSRSPVYAALGQDNSMWVAAVEKAFAHYRTGANTYASIEGGWGDEVNRAFGSTSAGRRSISSYSSATALDSDIYKRWSNRGAVTVNFAPGKKTVADADPLLLGHAYTVVSVKRNSAGVVTSIVLRNPWGTDGGGSKDSNPYDGLVTVTPNQIFKYAGAVAWGRV